MRIFELIMENVPPETVARDFVEAISSSNGNGNVSANIKHFLHSIMDGIGFNFYPTTEEISKKEFKWPQEECCYYVFRYRRSIFEQYQLFLEKTCKIMDEKFLHDRLFDIIDTFLSLCDAIDASWGTNFEEPFSLISLTLLRALHGIRKATPGAYLVLDIICDKLFKNSQKGLGFQNSHYAIFKGLCILLEKDYQYFSYYDVKVFRFYINCMEYEIIGPSVQLFRHLRNAIDNRTQSDEARSSLVSFLTDTEMIKAYCVFTQRGSKHLVISLLKFLNSLLRYLPVLECFTREQLHIIFSTALGKSKKMRSLAINFYLTYMKRSFENKLIFRDLLDFFLTYANSVDKIDGLIESLLDEFPYMANLERYLRILSKTERSIQPLSVTAQFAIRVYENLYKECENKDTYALYLSNFLLKLPLVLSSLKDKWQIRGILSHVYSITDCQVALVTIKDFPIAADNFIKYALQYLKKNDENYLIVQNIAHIMLKLMDFFNMHEEMDEFSNSIYQKYKEQTTALSELTEKQASDLQNTLVLLSALTDTLMALNEKSLFELVTDLAVRLFESDILQELSSKYDCFLDSYAITTYSGCLNILSIMFAHSSVTESSTESFILLEQTRPFQKYLIQRLSSEDQSKMTNVFIEAAFRALCELYVMFNHEMGRQVYHILVNYITKYVFETPQSTTYHLRHLEFQRNILQNFNILHKRVEIPVAITWKVVVYYGMAPNFEKELSELMDILFEYSSEKFKSPSLYTYIIPVAIFNLFKRRVHFRILHKALKAHKQYMESKMPDKNQRIMKLHIVLTIIDMIERAIQAGEIYQQPNRMQLLSNMNMLLTDVYQNESEMILSQTRRLVGHRLTRSELETLSTFEDGLLQ